MDQTTSTNEETESIDSFDSIGYSYLYELKDIFNKDESIQYQ